MSLLLPYELWEHIARLAIARPWGLNDFKAPVGDFDCVQGFAKTSSTFSQIVQSLKDEVFIDYSDNFLRLKVSDRVQNRTRHLEILSRRELLGQSPETHHYARMLCRKLERFLFVTSLSLGTPSPAHSPFILLGHVQGLPMSRTLSCLDISGSWYLRSDPALAKPPTIRFPNLLRLRLSWTPWSRPSLPVFIVDDAMEIALMFRGCQNLRLLSFHVALDDAETWREQERTHKRSLEHLQPSEGYERHIADCPLCLESYDHTSVIRRENSATRVLAEKFPSLFEVRWTNLWVRHRREESGQRATRISREGGSIVLIRDDGRDV